MENSKISSVPICVYLWLIVLLVLLLCNRSNLRIILRAARKRNHAGRLRVADRRQRLSDTRQFEHRIQTSHFKDSSYEARRISKPQANAFSFSLLAQL